MTYIRKFLYVFISILVINISGFIGYNLGKFEFTFSPPENNDATSPELYDSSMESLRISIIQDPESWASFSSSELGNNFNYNMTYSGVRDVTIKLDNNDVELENALQNGAVTEEDIFYFARLDAKAGLCKEICISELGLTTFTYCYPDFNLSIVYDIYETPDNQNTLISHIRISSTEYAPTAIRGFLNSETKTRLDVEDWGLSLMLNSVSPKEISIKSTQIGGQQIGQLYIVDFKLSTSDEFLDRIDGYEHISPVLNDPQPINMSSEGEIRIDWSEYYGELASGNYILMLTVQDIFDESQVHPLMVDYMDIWVYSVEFEIP